MDETNEIVDLKQINKIKLTEELFNKYGTVIKHIAYLYVKDRILAEDILQEVFISCFKNLDTFRGESSYKTWLIKITINKCKDALKRWSFNNILYKDKITDTFAKETPENILISKQEEYIVAMQLLKLPIKLREVIILYYFQELNIEEINLILNIKPNTIKSRLHRGRLLLKESLKESGFNWGID